MPPISRRFERIWIVIGATVFSLIFWPLAALMVLNYCIPAIQYFIGYDTPIPSHISPSQLSIAKKLSRLHAHFSVTDAGEIRIIDFYFDRETYDPWVTDGDLECIVGLSSLEELYLWNTGVENGGLRIAATLPKLRKLGLTVKSDADLSVLLACQNLKVLAISADITCERLEVISRLHGMEDLSLSRGTLTCNDLSALNSLEHLKMLSFSELPVTDEMLDGISETVEKLERCTLHSAQVTDRSARTLSHALNLSELRIANTGITDAGFMELSTLQKLETLSISHTSIGDSSVDILLSMPALRYLHAQESDISASGMQRLKAANRRLYVFMSDWSVDKSRKKIVGAVINDPSVQK
jgi:hypothetical protein